MKSITLILGLLLVISLSGCASQNDDKVQIFLYQQSGAWNQGTNKFLIHTSDGEIFGTLKFDSNETNRTGIVNFCDQTELKTCIGEGIPRLNNINNKDALARIAEILERPGYVEPLTNPPREGKTISIPKFSQQVRRYYFPPFLKEFNFMKPKIDECFEVYSSSKDEFLKVTENYCRDNALGVTSYYSFDSYYAIDEENSFVLFGYAETTMDKINVTALYYEVYKENGWE